MSHSSANPTAISVPSQDSLATLCAEARALHGQLAERFGRDADAAEAAELAAQLADARVVLAGAAGSLVGAQDRGG